MALVALMLFHAANNWAWLSTNVAILSADARRHLMTTLTYSDMLRPFGPVQLFGAVTMDAYRPPLFHLSAVPLVRLLGRSTDSATLVNVIYIALLLWATYAIGTRLFDRNVGLLSAFVVSAFPMIYGMSRYFYIDFALTAMVTLNIALLLRTEEFERRDYSVLYGLSFGLGMLVKWTFVVFTIPPALLVLFRSSWIRSLVRRRLLLRVDTRWALVSVLVSLVAILSWYLPNLATARQMFLGLWLLPVSWLLVAATLYAVSRPSGPIANLSAALMVGVCTAGIWYLPRIDFIREFLLVAYGKPKGTFWGFVPYLRYLADEQLSAFYVGVLILAVVIVVLRRRHDIRASGTRNWLASNYGAIVLWVVLPYFVFSIRTSTIHSRYIMPVLPALALVIGNGLLSIAGRKLKTALLALVVSVALIQFFALSYDGLGRVRAVATLQLPGGRQFNLFAHGYENQLPNTGDTDSRYWIMPAMLRFMIEDSTRMGRQGAELGILMRTHHVQASTFELVSLVEGYSELRMRELARAWSSAPVYPQVFELDYLVFKDGSQHGVNREETRQIIDALLTGSSAFLDEVFEVAQEYPMPDGDTVYLYRKRYHLDHDFAEDDYRDLARDVETRETGSEAIVLEIPEQIEVFARYYQGDGAPYPLPDQRPLDEEEVTLTLESVAAKHDLILAVFVAEEQVDPHRFVEQWLNRHGYRAMASWYGPVRLVAYGSPLSDESDVPARGIEAQFGDSISLLGFTIDGQEAEPGQVLRIKLFWKAEDSLEEDYKVFLHLLDAEGQIVAQHDGRPVGGFNRTTEWVEGQTTIDRHGVLIPWEVSPGLYRLALGMYDADTGRRLYVSADGQVVGDSLPLAEIHIGGS
jgi:4-amino-4-deoxy-L-arabinose transferase-like glycosyltransferase